ncbi:hypothetical protein FDUTEX481_07601 [Tolypothrix sp. PCC 7601]|nr:hypothetical protein FDUTEX481_07601 [Tolypothrix sp. PCC 7601]
MHFFPAMSISISVYINNLHDWATVHIQLNTPDNQQLFSA